MGGVRRPLTIRCALLLLAGACAACQDEPPLAPLAARLPAARVDEPLLRALDTAPAARALIRTNDVYSARALGVALGAERRFGHVPVVSAWLGVSELDRLRRDPDVQAIALDEGGAAHLAEALPLAGFPSVTAAGLTGADITVAIIDSGVDRSHPDLAGAVIDEACFCASGCCPGGLTEAFGPGSAADDSGHGTHVAGIVAGRGVVTGRPGGAPAARVIAIKILDAFNAFCCTSDLVAAIDWLIDQHPEIDVVNMSFGANGLYASDCDSEATVEPLSSAVDALVERGAVFVASSGNNGMIGLPAPACLPSVISVGAVWDADEGPQAILCSEAETSADRIACFSNTSPSLDLLAPGAIITSSWPDGLSRGRAGTSQAAPMVSACAALLLEAQPSTTPSALAEALRTSATWLLDSRTGAQTPRLDCGAALGALTPANDDAGSEQLDAGADAGAPAIDAAVEAGGPPIDAATDGSTDAVAEAEGGTSMRDAGGAGEPGTPDASLDGASPATDASAPPLAERDAADGAPDARVPADPQPSDADASDAAAPAPRAASDCACRTAGRRAGSGSAASLWLAIMVGGLLRPRTRARRSR